MLAKVEIFIDISFYSSEQSELAKRGLHTLWHFDTEESHTVLEGLGYVAGDDEACELLVFGVSAEDAVIVIELVELLSQLVAVVCYA